MRLILVGGLLGAAVLVTAVVNAPLDQRSRVDRIAENCKREFGYSQTDVTAAEYDCTVRMLNRVAADMEREKLDRVYQGSR
jgi:hypothetical protein